MATKATIDIKNKESAKINLNIKNKGSFVKSVTLDAYSENAHITYYNGDYDIIPTNSIKVLKTKGLGASNDITVEAIPYREVYDEENDTYTVYINEYGDFTTEHTNIGKIVYGGCVLFDMLDLTARSEYIREGYTAVTGAGKVTGTARISVENENLILPSGWGISVG